MNQIVDPPLSIPTIRMDELGPEEFEGRFYCAGRPVVITDCIAGWAARDWTPNSLKAAGKRPVRLKYNTQSVFNAHSREAPTGVVRQLRMSFAEALDLMQSEQGSHYYPQQASLRDLLPELTCDIERPPIPCRQAGLRDQSLARRAAVQDPTALRPRRQLPGAGPRPQARDSDRP